MNNVPESKRKPTLDELIARAEGRGGKGQPKKPNDGGMPLNELDRPCGSKKEKSENYEMSI